VSFLLAVAVQALFARILAKGVDRALVEVALGLLLLLAHPSISVATVDLVESLHLIYVATLLAVLAPPAFLDCRPIILPGGVEALGRNLGVLIVSEVAWVLSENGRVVIDYILQVDDPGIYKLSIVTLLQQDFTPFFNELIPVLDLFLQLYDLSVFDPDLNVGLLILRLCLQVLHDLNTLSEHR